MAVTKRKLSYYNEKGIDELKDLPNAYIPAFQSNVNNFKIPPKSFFDTFLTKEEITKIPNVEITSPNGTIDVQSSTDVQTNTKTFTIDVNKGAVPYAISKGSITFTAGSYYTVGTVSIDNIKSSGIEYANNKDGWVLKKDHVYVIAYNIIASTQGPSNEAIGGRIWLDGFIESDQVWKFVLDSSYVHDESLTGTAIVCINQDGEVHLNMRYDSNSLSSIPFAYINKVEIADITSIVSQGGGSGTTYSAGDAIDLTNDTISVKYGKGLELNSDNELQVKEPSFPAVVKTYHSGTSTKYTWKYTGVSSNYSKAAVTVTGLEPNKLHTVEFSMLYDQNYAGSYYMYVFASASESNMGVPTGYSRTSTKLADISDGMTRRLINCSWTLNSSANGEIFVNIVGNANPDNTTNTVSLNNVNYTVTRLK